MGEVLKGPGATEGGQAPGPMRQPDYATDVVGGAGRPVSQFVSIGKAVDNLLERLERQQNERAITVP
ncbi:MAG: hypothetical protein ACR2RF_26175 [Geminicoccaceae bacterium]